jgi:hypothetical protein
VHQANQVSVVCLGDGKRMRLLTCMTVAVPVTEEDEVRAFFREILSAHSPTLAELCKGVSKATPDPKDKKAAEDWWNSALTKKTKERREVTVGPLLV